MNLNAAFPPKLIPENRFVGLFGNNQNNWRFWVRCRLLKMGVTDSEIFESTDPGWKIVVDENGDELQCWVDELVRRQHDAMRRAHCIIFSLDDRERVWEVDSENTPEDNAKSQPRTIFAARCELGWLAGTKTRTFVWIANDLVGRNYLRGVVGLYEHMTLVDTLEHACESAAKFLKRK